MSSVSPLFEPIRIGTLELKNRIVMAPMTRSKSPGGVPGANVASYYSRRAAADVGFILTEGTVVGRLGGNNDRGVPNFFEPDSLAGWGNVAREVHAVGGKISPQLWHQGMMRKPGTGPFPDAPTDSPSGITHSGKQVMEAPTTKDVEDMIAAFVTAAGEAKRLGFDSVQFHGAHGYLIDEFFWPVMNHRDDRFGGPTLAERARFAAEIISETRRVVGPDFVLSLRISQWKQQDYEARLAQTPQELESFLSVLSEAGVDIFDCSQRRFWEPEFPEIDGEKGLNFAGWTKKLTGKPTITVGSVGLSSDFVGAFRGENSKARPLSELVERLERGEFDLVAVGRAILQDPHWAQKVKEGRTSELMDYDAASLATLS